MWFYVQTARINGRIRNIYISLDLLAQHSRTQKSLRDCVESELRSYGRLDSFSLQEGFLDFIPAEDL